MRGLFSGGTLCYESLVILGRTLGEVHSNTPLDHGWGLPAPPGRTSASTSARRSTPAAGRTR